MEESREKIQSGDGEESGDYQASSLAGHFERLEPLTQLSAEIGRCILSEEEIADDASVNLKHIRRNIAVTGETDPQPSAVYGKWLLPQLSAGCSDYHEG